MIRFLLYSWLYRQLFRKTFPFFGTVKPIPNDDNVGDADLRAFNYAGVRVELKGTSYLLATFARRANGMQARLNAVRQESLN